MMSLIAGMSFASPGDVETVTARLQQLGVRADGSQAERNAFSAITKILDDYGIGYTRESFDSMDRGHSFSENLVVDIPGDPERTYIIAAPVDGGAYTISILLELARRFSTSPPVNSVRLLFLGAERGNSGFHPFGSRTAIGSIDTSGRSFLIYLDSEDIPAFWFLRAGADGNVAPLWMVDTVTRALSNRTIPFHLRGTDLQVARLGLQGDTGPLKTFLDAGVPSILLHGSGRTTGSERVRRVERLLGCLSDIDRQVGPYRDSPQRTYLFLRFLQGMTPTMIPERTYLTAFLSVIALLLMISLVRIRDIRVNIRRLSRFWWTWPLLLMLVFLFLFLSTLIIEETILIADFPDIWTFAPGVFIFFKLAVAAALSLNFILVTQGLPLPRSPHFYSYSAVLTSILTTFLFISFDVTLAAYPLWTVVSLMMFTTVRRERYKYLFFLLSVIPYLMGLTVIVREPYTSIIASFLLDRVRSNVILTSILLPEILAVVSLGYLRTHYDRTRSRVITRSATLSLSIAAMVTLIWVLNLNPFNQIHLQPVDLVDRIDMDAGVRRIEVRSPTSIGDAELFLEERLYPLENLGRTAEIRTSFSRTPLNIRSEDRLFLGRRTIRVQISGEENPDRIQVKLVSPRPFTVHDVDFPHEMAPSGTEAEIFIGDRPPFPLELNFTVNADADISMTVAGEWTDPEGAPVVVGSGISYRTYRMADLKTEL